MTQDLTENDLNVHCSARTIRAWTLQFVLQPVRTQSLYTWSASDAHFVWRKTGFGTLAICQKRILCEIAFKKEPQDVKTMQFRETAR